MTPTIWWAVLATTAVLAIGIAVAVAAGKARGRGCPRMESTPLSTRSAPTAAIPTGCMRPDGAAPPVAITFHESRASSMAAPRTVESTVAANHGEHHDLNHHDLTHAHLIAQRPTGSADGSGVSGSWTTRRSSGPGSRRLLCAIRA